jgi:hypothetical protein
MRLINYFLLALVFISSCKEDTEETPPPPNDYGSGLYIATDNGVSFYDGDTIKNQIYRTVNSTTLSNVEKIKFKGTKAYIAADNYIFTANVKTFEDRGIVSGFVNPVDFDFAGPDDRVFVVDKGDSRVKVVDIERMEIISDIETGDNTQPVFIISKWWRSIIMNGGLVADSLKDSTIVAINYRDNLVPLADFMGSLKIGDNPNSAVWNGNVKVLCKGIYDPNNPIDNTESSFYNIEPWDFEVYWNKTLNGIYNASNLIESPSSSMFYFLAEGGVYLTPQNASSTTQISNIESDVLLIRNEWYAINDTTDALAEMLYLNDAENNPNILYKYNLVLSSFTDTIIVDGNVRDINFY